MPPTDLVMFTAAFPVWWLTAIGGVSETAARLPVIAYAVGIGFGVLAVSELNAKRWLSTSEVSLMLLGVAAVVFTLALNTAYDPYSTDLASPID
jgi:hypothetical protein